jgi:hypothetical protein
MALRVNAIDSLDLDLVLGAGRGLAGDEVPLAADRPLSPRGRRGTRSRAVVLSCARIRDVRPSPAAAPPRRRAGVRAEGWRPAAAPP